MLLRCYFSFVLPVHEYFSEVWLSAAKCHLQLLERQVYSVVRLCSDNRVSCRYVIDVVWWDLVCCTRLIRTLITVCSASFYLLLLEFDIRAAAADHPLEFEVSKCRTSGFARSFLPAQVRLWNDLPHTVSDTGTLDGFKGTVNRWLLP